MGGRGALAVLAVLFLAGCSDPEAGRGATGSDEDGSQVAAPTDVGPGLSAAGPAATAGTLRFRNRPTMSAAPPAWNEPLRLPVPSITDQFTATIVGLPPLTQPWTFQWPGGPVVGNGTLWVDVQGPLVHYRQGCFWELEFEFGGGERFRACVGDEPPAVAQGLRRLDFEVRSDLDYAAGEAFVQLFGGAGPNPPGTEVVVLADSAEADSQITFQGVTFGGG